MTRFEYCEYSNSSLMYIRAIQGHTGGNKIALELMGHVAIPYIRKELVFHRGCSFDIKSILETGLIAGKKRKQGVKTNYILHTSKPFWGKLR